MRRTKQGILTGLPMLLGVAVVCSLFAGAAWTTQTTPQTQEPERLTHSVKGADLFRADCAACHGDDLKGTGPAPYPFRAAPDLTTLARRHGGKFPEAYVSRVLREGVVMPAHGPAEMPVWGPDFTMDRPGQAQAALRITSLTNYIKSMQEK